MEKKKNRVRKLEEKLETGELTPKEAQRILQEQGLTHREDWKDFIWYIAWAILCFLPGIAKSANPEILSPLVQLPTLKFPTAAVYSSTILLVSAICIEAYVFHWRVSRGGLGSEDDTVVLIKEGPYRIVRHPSTVDWTIGFITITIAISDYAPFTVLSILGNTALIICHYKGTLAEEELNLKKWGDEYEQYMKEVPRFNFIRGLWNLRKEETGT